jgi:hypothetical protein
MGRITGIKIKGLLILSAFFMVCSSQVIRHKSTISKGLMLYYPLLEGGGNIAVNYGDAGSRYNGVLTNGATWTPSPFGKVAKFDGTDDYIESNYIMATATSFTMGGWGYSTSNGLNNRMMGNADASTGNTGADIIWGYSGASQLYCVRRNNANVGTLDFASITVPNLTSRWHHIMITYDVSSGSKLYFDGVLMSSNTNLGFASVYSFKIGRDGLTNTPFNGNVCHVGIWNRALTQQEVKQLFITPNILLK